MWYSDGAHTGSHKREDAALETILVVDDKCSVRDIVSEILTQQNYLVVEATDGQEAIDKLGCTPAITSIILDVNMPGLNGWETLRYIRDIDTGWPDTRVVMFTMVKDPEAVLRAWAMGADYYLPKPFTRQQLLTTIGRCYSAT